MAVIISGASDDLIEIAGDIREEFQYQKPGYGQPTGDLIGFSDGTVLRVEFRRELHSTCPLWRITPVARGSATLTIEQSDETGDYGTDTATLDGDIQWVVQGIAIVQRKV